MGCVEDNWQVEETVFTSHTNPPLAESFYYVSYELPKSEGPLFDFFG